MDEYTYRLYHVRVNRNYYFRVILLKRFYKTLQVVKCKSFNKRNETAYDEALKYMEELKTIYL